MSTRGIQDLPFPKKTFIPVKCELEHDLCLEQWVVPKGTTIILMTTHNHGVVSIPKNCKDIRGFNIPRQLFKY